MSTRPLRVGIVGSGFGGTVHAPAFAAHPAFELVAIASPNSAAKIAQERKIPHHFASHDEMLANVELDVLSIAAPPALHHPAAVAALERGLHVLCEKPFALNIAQAEEMCAAAERAGKIGAIAHEFRFLSTRQAMRELILNKHLGPVRQIEITQNSSFLRSTGDRARGWWFERAKGGGISGAWLSHLIDMACWLAGRPPQKAIGLGRTAIPNRMDKQGAFESTVEDGTFVVLDFGDGLIARLTVDGTVAVNSMICAVHGEERIAVASGDSIFTERLFAVDHEETSELEVEKLPYAHLSAASPMLPSFLDMLTAFHDRIEGRESMVATFADGLTTQRVLAATGYGEKDGG